MAEMPPRAVPRERQMGEGGRFVTDSGFERLREVLDRERAGCGLRGCLRSCGAERFRRTERLDQQWNRRLGIGCEQQIDRR